MKAVLGVGMGIANMIWESIFKIKSEMLVEQDGCLTMPGFREDNTERIEMTLLILRDGTVSAGMRLTVWKEMVFMSLIRYFKCKSTYSILSYKLNPNFAQFYQSLLLCIGLSSRPSDSSWQWWLEWERNAHILDGWFQEWLSGWTYWLARWRPVQRLELRWTKLICNNLTVNNGRIINILLDTQYLSITINQMWWLGKNMI